MSKRILKSRVMKLASEKRQADLEKKALMLRDISGLTVKQISNRLKFPIHQVRKMLKAGRMISRNRLSSKKRSKRFNAFSGQIDQEILNYVRGSDSLTSIKGILAHLWKTQRFRCSASHLRSYLRSVLGLSYQRVGVVTPNQNSIQCKIYRQLAAKAFIENLSLGKTVINIDESVLSYTDHRCRGWSPVRERTRQIFRQRLPSFNIIAGVSNNGRLFFTLNRGRTNSQSFILFLSKLCSYLDSKSPNWRSQTVIMLDNASYHKSKLTRKFIERLGIPVLYLGPYQFQMAPVEKLFAFIKQKQLNPQQLRVTGRQFHCCIIILLLGTTPQTTCRNAPSLFSLLTIHGSHRHLGRHLLRH